MSDTKKVRLDELEPADFNGEKNRVVELYTTHGKSIAYIAQVIGRSAPYVSKLLHAAYQEDKSERELRILAHAQGLKYLMQKTIDRIEKAGHAFDRRDAELWAKLREQEARLRGLDQPVQHEVKVEIEQYTDDELIAQLRQAGVQVSLPTVIQPAALPEHVDEAEFQIKPESE